MPVKKTSAANSSIAPVPTDSPPVDNGIIWVKRDGRWVDTTTETQTGNPAETAQRDDSAVVMNSQGQGVKRTATPSKS